MLASRRQGKSGVEKQGVIYGRQGEVFGGEKEGGCKENCGQEAGTSEEGRGEKSVSEEDRGKEKGNPPNV